jgi:omega-amidase
VSRSSSLAVLLVQARLAWKNPAENRDHLERQLAASQQPFDLAIFPETFTTGFLGDPDLPAEGMDGPTVEWMQRLARRYHSALAGSAVIVEQGRRFNRFLLVEADGNARYYDKRHLFAYGGENQRYVAGRERAVWPLGDWRLCPQICYDLRFPVWCRNRNDYDVLVFVANWPGGRIHHWTALLRARAIENQAWVIGVNRVGEDGNGMAYPGCSQVFDPAGEQRADLGGNEESRLVRIDLGQVAATQKSFPFQADADDFELLRT